MDAKNRVFHNEIVFSKNDDWSYEQEMRQLYLLAGLKRRPLDNGALGYFLPFPPEALVSATLGTRCSDTLSGKVISALKNPKLAHVKLDQAFLHQSEFALGFADVSRGP